MAISAEQLNIILNARDKEFTKAMERSEKRVARFAKQSQGSLGKASAAFGKLSSSAAAFLPALSAAALVSAVKNVVSSLDEIGKKADQIGLTTDALQELRSIAESAGVSQEKLDSSMERFSKRLGEAAKGTGAAKKALEDLNLTASDLLRMPLDDALSEVADRLSAIESPASQAAAAAAIFGREGVAMINMMRDGAAGMDAMRQEARELGIVIDEDLIRNAEGAQTQLDLMSRVINANLSSALINLAPHLVSAATGIANLSGVVSEFFSAMGGGNFEQIELLDAAGLEALAKQYSGLERELAAVGQARDALNAAIRRGDNEAEISFKQRLTKAEEDLAAKIKIRQDQEAATQRGVTGIQNLKDATAEMAEQARLNALSAQEAERQRIATQRAAYEQAILNDYQASGYELTDESMAAVTELGRRWEEAATSASKILNPTEKATAATKNLNEAVKEVSLSAEEMAQKLLDVSPNLRLMGFDAENLVGIARSIEGSMENAFMSMVDGTESAKDAFKSMAAQIIKELYRVLVVQRLVSAITGAFGGGVGGAPTTSLRPPIRPAASGRPVTAGEPYVTGEHGRELFVPKVNGRILSAAQTNNMGNSGGDGVTVIQNNTFQSGVTRSEVSALLPRMVEASKAAVLDAKRQGGSYGKAFS